MKIPQTKLSIRRKDAILGLEADSTADHTATITTVPLGMQFNAGGMDKIYIFEEGILQVDGSVQVNDNIQVAGTFEANGSVVLNPATDAVMIDKNAETLKLVGTDHSYLSFFPQGINAGIKGEFGFTDQDSTHISLKNETPDGDINISSSGGDLNLKTPNGRVLVENRIEITPNGGGPFTMPTSHRRYHNAQFYDYGTTHTTSTAEDIGLVCYSDIVAHGFRTWSDQRIKKDLKLSDNQDDLKILTQIQVTDYRHIDEYSKGTNFRKGLIAQQVKSVFPEAVILNTEYTPNIYSFSTQIDLTDHLVKITLKNPHRLKVDDKVKIITPDGEECMLVQNINDAFSFSVTPKDIEIKDEVFVYGKEVDDFHSVDYDRVFTLTVSATQELARKVETLERALANSEKEKVFLQSKLDKTDEILKTLNTKVEALESTFDMTGQH